MKWMKKHLIVFSILLVVLMVWTMAEIMQQRFSRGDIYPPYSSMRVDPFGTKALYKTYTLANNGNTGRNMRPFRELAVKNDTTLIIPGVHPVLFTNPDIFLNTEGFDQDIYNFVLNGGRLAIFLMNPDEKHLGEGDGGRKKKSLSNKAGEKHVLGNKTAFRIKEKLNLEFRPLGISTESRLAVPEEKFRKTFRPVPLYSTIYLDLPQDSWETVFMYGGKTILAERMIGKGSVVVGTDSYMISNEALFKNPDPQFLSWLAGTHRTIIFDEYLNGMNEERNIVWLVKESSLGAFIAVMLLIIILMLWKNFLTVSNIRVDCAATGGNVISSTCGSFRGLVNLLGMSVGKKKIINVCYDEWSRSANLTNMSSDIVKEVGEIIGKSHERPSDIYNKICAVIRERRFGRKS